VSDNNLLHYYYMIYIAPIDTGMWVSFDSIVELWLTIMQTSVCMSIVSNASCFKVLFPVL